MRHRPLAAAAATALLVGLTAAPAAARTTAASTPAAGTSTSALNLLSLALASHAVQVGGLALTNDTTTGSPLSKVVVTPLTVDGTKYGEQTVTPANSPASVPVVDSSAVVPAALGALASVKSPAFNVSSSDSNGASSKAGATSLGSISVLGLPLALDGTVDVTSAVTDAQALGEKNVTVKNLALPSIADLLAALGLNLPKVPVDTLNSLLKGLNLTNTAVATAQKALTDAEAAIRTQIDAAQKAVDDATAALAAKTTELTGAKSQLAAAEADLAAKTAALQPLKDALASAQANLTAANGTLTTATTALNAQLSLLGLPAGTPLSSVPLASQALLTPYYDAVAAAQTAVTSATAAVTKATSDLAAAQSVADAAQVVVNTLKTTVATLQAAVDALQKTLSDAIAALNGILAGVQPQIDALLAAITALLDSTPLVSIDSISIQTQALVTSATSGGQSAKIVGGELVGLHVLGTDVLKNVLGSSSVDLLDLAGTTLTQVTGAINTLTGTLSSVLSNVPSLPTLSIPAPQIGLFTKSASTGIAGGFGTAQNSLKALTITIPAITLPAAVALPNAASLPAISGLTGGAAVPTAAGDLVSKPITLGLVSLSEQSKFHPALTTAPGTTPPGTTPPGSTPETPNLATTGLPAGIALLAILCIGGALLMRRRLADGTEV